MTSAIFLSDLPAQTFLRWKTNPNYRRKSITIYIGTPSFDAGERTRSLLGQIWWLLPGNWPSTPFFQQVNSIYIPTITLFQWVDGIPYLMASTRPVAFFDRVDLTPYLMAQNAVGLPLSTSYTFTTKNGDALEKNESLEKLTIESRQVSLRRSLRLYTKAAKASGYHAGAY